MPPISLRWLTTLWLILATSLFHSPSINAGDLNAQVDRTAIASNESLTLTLTYNGKAVGAPDFSSLEKDFDIVSRQQQSQLSFGFGADTSTTEWVLALVPKRTGELVIPSFRFNKQVSDAIPIKVSAAKASNDRSQDIFIETELEQDSAYVQSEVLLTLRLNTSVMLSSVDIPDLMLPDARVIKIHDSQFQKTIAGQNYVVVEISYAIFPEKPGTLDIPALPITGVVPSRSDPFGGRGFFGTSGKPVRLASEAKRLKVLPIPDGLGGAPWIPAKGLSISQRWSNGDNDLTVGEPVTRTITVSAQGLPGAQLPPLHLAAGAGYKTYPDQPEINETLSASGVLGTRTESEAIVPTQPGALTLPAITVRWWDVNAQTFRETQLDAVTVNVLPSKEQPAEPSATTKDEETAQSAETPSPAPLTVGNNRLLTFSLAANLSLALLLALALAWKVKHRPTTAPAPVTGTASEQEKAAFKSLQASDPGKPNLARGAILHWARLYWPDARIHTLADVAAASGDKRLAQLFTEMDNALYGSGSTQRPDVAAIIGCLTDIRRRGQGSSGNESTLAPLYPHLTN